MKTSNYIMRVLEPENNGYITQSAEVEAEQRILSKKVFLAVNDSVENWKEITKEEGDAIEAEQVKLRKLREQEMK